MCVNMTMCKCMLSDQLVVVSIVGNLYKFDKPVACVLLYKPFGNI